MQDSFYKSNKICYFCEQMKDNGGAKGKEAW